MKIGSLFSGAGGLDMAVAEVFGGDIAWHSEIDKAASKVLAYRWPDVPNLGSVTEIDWATVEPVDILCGGFPCQDVSAAGNRAGIKDGTRSGLWAVFADAIDALRPQYVVIENVRGLLSATAHRSVEPDSRTVGDRASGPALRAAGAVLGDLANIGYDAVWATVSAASVGAPHRRERVFIVATLADTTNIGCEDRGQRSGVVQALARVRGADVPLRGYANAADSSGNGRDERRPEPARLQRGFDVAVSGDAAGRVELLPTPRSSRGGSTNETTYAFGGVRSDDNRTQGEVLLPTPVVTDSFGTRNSTSGRQPGSQHHSGDTLTDVMWKLEGAALLLTPNAQDGNGGGRYSSEGHQSTLPGEVRLLPTPRSSDCFGAGQHGEGGLDLRTTISLLPTPTAGDGMAGGVRTVPDGNGGRREVDWDDTTRSTGDGGASRLRDTPPLIHGSQWGKYAAAIARWEQAAGPAPAPTEPNRNGKPRLNPAFSEWMMGWPAGWVTDPVIGISRNDQLRIIGNGVCSQQAVAALRHLLAVTT